MKQLPDQARVVIVGGGIMGCSTAYHLALNGCPDVLVLEQAKLTSGSTWHAAGLVGQLRNQAGITQLLGQSIELYNSIEAETDQATGWKMNGGLRLACCEERMTELKRQATTAHSFGLDMHLLTPSEARELWPAMDISDLVGAVFLPTDGQANPSDVTQALAKGARQRGVTFVEECAVTGIQIDNNRVVGVTTPRGAVRCETLVNCCGQWAREFGRLAGVNVPLVSVQHQYLITEPIEAVGADLPTLRDPDRLTYFKEEVGGLIMGGYEHNPRPWAQSGIPTGFSHSLLDGDWDHFESLMSHAMARVPALETAGVKQLVNGPESFTPDGNFILGEAPEIAGYYVGAGFNSFGIAAGGGAGRALAEWILGGESPYDLWAVDIRRFGRPHLDSHWVRTRTLEMYAKHYTLAWPHEENESGRPLRRSPLYAALSAAGGCFGEKLGWERANWFAPSGVEARDQYSFGRQNWFCHVGEEHRAVREQVAVIDQTSFAKFMLTGHDAEAALGWICANDVAKPTGALTYTQMLNSRGGIECDLTVARLAPDQYYLVTGTGFASHDAHWIRSHIGAGLHANLVDVTSAYAVLSIMGPRTRDLLQPLTDDDLSNTGFPFAAAKHICVAGAPALALRVTYVGELGWELHIPVEFAQCVYDTLMHAGKSLGVKNAGYRAIESLRLEKGFCAWGAELTPDHTPLEAGLGWAIKFNKNIAFMGRESLLVQRDRPLQKRLVGFTLEDPSMTLLGRETIYRDGERVGWLTSGGYGHSVKKSIGYGYVRRVAGVDTEYLLGGQYELEVATERVACDIHLTPLYDPRMQRVKV